MRFLLLLNLILTGLIPCGAQKFLQIEKAGSLKVRKYFIGDELSFQVKDGYEKYWRTEIIEDLLVDERILIFPKGMVRLEDITAVKSYRGARNARRFSLMFYNFAAGWVLFSIADSLLGGTLTWSVAVVSGSALVLGWTINKIFGSRKYRIGKNRRLRMLDLTIKVNTYGP